MLLTSEILARKYAKAYFRMNQRTISDEHIMQLKNLLEFCSLHKSLLSYLTIPSLSDQTKQHVIQTLCDTYAQSSSLNNLFNLLIAHKRVELIIPVITSIIRLYNTKNNILTVSIQTSHTLDEQELASIIKFVQTKTGAHTVIPSVALNPNLICGIRVSTETWLWEHSVQRLIATATSSVLRQVEL